MYIARDREDDYHMMAEGKSDELEMPDLGGLAEEMEKAMAQVRKAVADLPPLEELAAIQEAMAGLAQMGALTEKIRLVAEQHEELVAELAKEANEQGKEGQVSADESGVERLLRPEDKAAKGNYTD
jgi:hypothetical protein